MLPHAPLKFLLSCLPKPLLCLAYLLRERAFLIVSQKDRLDEPQRKYVEQIRQGHPDLEMAYQLGQGFVMMLAERRGGDWILG